MTRLEEVTQRIGSRPALLHMEAAGISYRDAREYRVEEGIAIIDISGPLSNAAWSWRGSTYGDIQSQLQMADADPDVYGILLDINSPGGETDMAFETAAMIAALEKPCYAVADSSCYSAAYLLASQADKIYGPPVSCGVGSIGILCMHADMSEALKNEGVKVTLLSAGKGKTDGNPYEPLSTEAKQAMQAEVDRLYGEFTQAVARGRGMTVDALVKIGAAKFEGSQAAIASGLMDASGGPSRAWSDLLAETQKQKPNPGMPYRMQDTQSKPTAATAANPSKEKVPMEKPNAGAAEPKVPTAAEIETMLATARAEGLAQGRTEGRGEATRIFNICAIAGVQSVAQVADYLNTGKSEAEVSAALLAAKVEADKKTAVDNNVQPKDPKDPNAEPEKPQGKAQPWGQVFAKLGFAKKEAK